MKNLKSIKNSLYTKDELNEIKGGLGEDTNKYSSETGDPTCSSSLDDKDVPDCFDGYSQSYPDEVVTTAEFDSPQGGTTRPIW